MIPAHINGANAYFGKPADWDEEKMGECVTLPVLVHNSADGACMSSLWVPTPEELEALTRGHGVVVTIFGLTHPPVAIGVSAEPHP